MGRVILQYGMLLALASCIIYRVDSEPPQRDEPRDPPAVPEPAPLPADLYLVVDEARVGESLRTTLKTRDDVGFDGLQAVRFERDVTVTDAVFDLVQAELVIAISEEAEPGSIDLVAQFREGATVRATDAFTIRPAAEPKETADTGTPPSPKPTGDTGTSP